MDLFLAAIVVLALCPVLAFSQDHPFRPPAYPLVTCDPYFSIWSFADHPAEDWSRHWTGSIQALSSLVRVDGTTRRLLGLSPSGIEAMPLSGFQLTPTRTIYAFEDGKIQLDLAFTTPLLPWNLDVFARPAAYIDWNVRSMDGKPHSVSLYFDHSAELVVNITDQEVAWSRFDLEGLDVLSMGSVEQPVLKKKGDDLRIDWGYVFLASSRSQNGMSVISDHRSARETFVRTGRLPASDDMDVPRPAEDRWPVSAFAFDLGDVIKEPVERFVVLAYDDRFSIEYLDRKLRPYWRRHGLGPADLIADAISGHSVLVEQCRQFDEELLADLTTAGGPEYARLACLAFRQAMAAHKLCIDVDGTPMFFPKENFSNGCISTVDVIYPAAPILLFFNVDLLKATLVPLLKYSMTGRWRFPFAPHDLGTYPLANGQVYGGGETGEENQMPVEESGNLLILMDAVARMDGNADFARPFWKPLETWARYLAEKGLDPENQLCTDDFAGHLAHNVNLSAKAILALGAWADLCAMDGKTKQAREYRKMAETYAKQWISMADDGDHFRLAFDKPGTWSQKYNLVWDRILDLNLFPKDVARKEIEYYKKMQNQYGLPLDIRKDYTKLDWILWTASLTETRADFDKLVGPVCRWMSETPDRVPLTDWYDTKTGKQVGFQARSVVGGVFMPMLAWKKILEKRPHD